MSKYVLIGVEGPHDQAFVERVLKVFFDFTRFDGNSSDLDSVWRKFIPTYPSKNGKLYQRLDMPSILTNSDFSVAVYSGGGSNLANNITDKFSNDTELLSNLMAFAIVADTDKNSPLAIINKYRKGFQDLFPEFPRLVENDGAISGSSTKLGIYLLPDNSNHGVLDTLLSSCGDQIYPQHMERARNYIDQFSEINWSNFDKDKATIATVVSVLKPGKTNTVSIADNNWISEETKEAVPNLNSFVKFLTNLFAF